MTLPDWVAHQARTKMEPNEQIVEVQVLKEGLFGKLAVVQTSERNLVVSRGLFSGRAFDLVRLGTEEKKTKISTPRLKAPGPIEETPTPRPKVAAPVAKATSAVSSSDDLTAIDGIGKVRAEKLNAAGVFSFADLAASDAAALATNLNVSADTVEAWQAAAKKA